MMNIKIYVWDAVTSDRIAFWDVPIIPGLGDIFLVAGRQMRVVKIQKDFTVESRTSHGVIGGVDTLIVNARVNLVSAEN